jgi:3-(methylthio)propionyl---CoA ligase
MNMFGQMMDRPLLISDLVRHGDRQHPLREIVSITADHPRHRYTFREAFARTRKLANALKRIGIKQSDRIATLAWNDFRHFETYYDCSTIRSSTS